MRLLGLLILFAATPAAAQWSQPFGAPSPTPGFMAPPPVQNSPHPQFYRPPRAMETLDQAHERQRANRYDQDRRSGGQPLGGYYEPLGDPRVPPPGRRW